MMQFLPRGYVFPSTNIKVRHFDKSQKNLKKIAPQENHRISEENKSEKNEICSEKSKNPENLLHPI